MFQKLISWSKKYHPHLPWREERTLYRTLVSEIMLQQTTVGTVKNHFERFLSKFPDLTALAQATEDEVLIQWKGLGYYRRAKNLRKIAIQIVENFDGKIPSETETLMNINGIGPYTAFALRAIGHNKDGLAIDANIERVLSRFYGISKKSPKELHLKLRKKISKEKIKDYRAFNEALMDCGRVLCQSRKVNCELCPLSQKCQTYLKQLPILSDKKIKEKHELKLLRLIIEKNGKVLAYEKEKGEWLSGQWELPTFILDSTDKKLSQYPKTRLLKRYDELPVKKSGITKYKIENRLLRGKPEDLKKLKFKRKTKWISLEGDHLLSSLSTKIIQALD